MAKGQRGSLKGAVFHSDHGSVYTSQAFQDTCKKLGVRQSMDAVGTSADNSLAESFNAALKREVLQDSKTFASQLVCRREVFEVVYQVQHKSQAFLVWLCGACGV